MKTAARRRKRALPLVMADLMMGLMGDDCAAKHDDHPRHLYCRGIPAHGYGEGGGGTGFSTGPDYRARRESSVGAVAQARCREREAAAA